MLPYNVVRDDVVSVFPSKLLQLQTTASWDFMGFSQNFRRNLKIESDIIIGDLDTGIWPESNVLTTMVLAQYPKNGRGSAKAERISPATSNFFFFVIFFVE